MTLKIVMSDQEYKTLIKKMVREEMNYDDFFNKYIDILPYKILQIAHENHLIKSKKYWDKINNSICVSDLLGSDRSKQMNEKEYKGFIYTKDFMNRLSNTGKEEYKEIDKKLTIISRPALKMFKEIQGKELKK